MPRNLHSKIYYTPKSKEKYDKLRKKFLQKKNEKQLTFFSPGHKL